MKKYKISMIFSVIIVAILLLNILIPVVSNAGTEDDFTMSAEKKVTSTGYDITVTATSNTYNIMVLKYANANIEINANGDNYQEIYDYFEGTNSIATNIEMTAGKSIEKTFSVTQYGDYTIYARNSDGEIALLHTTVTQPSEVNISTNINTSGTDKVLEIGATSLYNITAIKVVKVDNASDIGDFSNTENLVTTASKSVNAEYTISENGIYQVYAEDENNNSKTQVVSVYDGNSPITINANTDATNKQIVLQIADSISNITVLKIAEKSNISSISDFETTGTSLNFSGTISVSKTISVEAEGTYVIYVEDEAGNKYMKEVTVSSEPTEDERSIDFYIKSGENTKVYAIITDKYNISTVRYTITNERGTLSDTKTYGYEVAVTSAKQVMITIDVTNLSSDKYVNIYEKDSEGYGYFAGTKISTIDVVNEIPEVETGTGTEGGTTSGSETGTGTEGGTTSGSETGTGTEGGTTSGSETGTGTEGGTTSGSETGTGTEGGTTSGSETGTGTEGGTTSGSETGTGTEGGATSGSETGTGTEGGSTSGSITVEIPDSSENNSVSTSNQTSNNIENTSEETSENTNTNAINTNTEITDNTTSNTSLPQTGINDAACIFGIIIFSIIGIVSYVNYKKM